jgi:hypothetical protein
MAQCRAKATVCVQSASYEMIGWIKENKDKDNEEVKN